MPGGTERHVTFAGSTVKATARDLGSTALECRGAELRFDAVCWPDARSAAKGPRAGGAARPRARPSPARRRARTPRRGCRRSPPARAPLVLARGGGRHHELGAGAGQVGLAGDIPKPLELVDSMHDGR